MRVRKLALAVGLVSALGGNAALALGLGEIKLNSTLNQPLNAEISLLQTRGLGENEIRVRLASPEDFERAGVDRSYLLSELRFDVDYSGSQPVLRVTSGVPIREPFLNFLVETRWPSGRLLREYTLLMDLPAFSDSTAAAPVRAAERERQQVQREAPVQQPAPRPAAPARPVVTDVEPETAVTETAAAEEPVELSRESRPQVTQAPAQTGSQVYGPVAANQTLWEIALQARESRDLSVQQTMLAIQRLNPEAFIDNNINLLKRGSVLRLPSAEEVRSLSMSQAVAEVAAQNGDWRARPAVAAALGAPLDARAATEERTVSESVEGRVSLAAPGDNESLRSGSGSGAEDSEALAGELVATEEELDRSRLENAELQERLGELEEQIDTMERLVEVSSDELSAVQAAAGQALEQQELAEEAAELAEVADATEPEAVEEAEPEVVAEAIPEVDDSRNRVVLTQVQPEPSLMDRVMENIQLIAIGAGVLLLALVGFISWRRRKEEEEAIRQVEAEMAAERALAEAPSLGEADENLAAVEELESVDSFDLDQLDDVDTGDPVAEAEIHLSLGQYRDAEKKLLAGLEASPNHVDARLMLLEVYAHEQKVDRFDDHYRQLLSVSDGPATDRAARLRETIVGAGQFEAPVMDFSSESLEAAQLDDIGASFDDDFSSEMPAGNSLLDDLTLDLPGADSDASHEDDSDEFSLDLELDSGLEMEAETGSAESDDDGFNLDDLMGGELELDGLELDAGESGSEPAEDEGGLDFELDLTPMDEEEPAQELEAKPSAQIAAADDSDDLGSFGDDLDGLDLDSIDLGDIADLDSGDLDAGLALEKPAPAAASAPQQPAPQQSTPTAAQPASSAGEEADLGDLSFNLESDLDSELNLLEGSDEVSTKLELAQAYLDMGDKEGAKDILGEVVEEGNGEHKQRAQEMLERIM